MWNGDLIWVVKLLYIWWKIVDLDRLIVIGTIIQNEVGMNVIIGEIDLRENLQMSMVWWWYGGIVGHEKFYCGW